MLLILSSFHFFFKKRKDKSIIKKKFCFFQRKKKFCLEIYDEKFNIISLISESSSYMNLENDNHEFNIRYGYSYNKRKCIQFYDIDIEKVLECHGRYIVVNVFKGESETGTFGWMEREFFNKNNEFDPSSVRQKLNINKERDGCPVILDCQIREFIWIDYQYPINYLLEFVQSYDNYYSCRNRDRINATCNLYSELNHNNSIIENGRHNDDFTVLEDCVYYFSLDEYIMYNKNYKYYSSLNTKIKQFLFSYYFNPMRISMSELIHLHIQARNGTLTKNENDLQEGDYAFVPYRQHCKNEKVNYIPCSHFDIILSEYMKSIK